MTKKVFVSMVLAGALAIGCVGISNGLRVDANAEELSADVSAVNATSGNHVVMSAPYIDPNPGFGMVQYLWKAEQCSYMYVSPDGNWNSGYTQIAAQPTQQYAVYKEVRVSSVGTNTNSGISQKFAKSFYRDSDGDLWESSVASYTGSDTSTHTVALSIVSGTITTEYTTYSHSGTVGKYIYVTGAYAGEMANCSTLYQLNSTNVGKTVEVTVGSVTYTVEIGLTSFNIKASRKVTCSSTSTAYNYCGALTISFDTP